MSIDRVFQTSGCSDDDLSAFPKIELLFFYGTLKTKGC
jgi:hypothetical protein